MLWYGFMTEDDKMHINQYIINRLKEEDIKEYTCVELIINSIRKDTIICNPGILGSGILATNLSQESNTTILEYSNMLVCIYSNIKYKDYDGKLYDCDFNLAAGLPVLGGETIFDVVGKPYKIRKIRMDKHCYACTAGAGSS